MVPAKAQVGHRKASGQQQQQPGVGELGVVRERADAAGGDLRKDQLGLAGHH